MIVTAHQGDTVDDLCNRHLGTSDVLETVLATNPGLSALGAVLPMGTSVLLPDAVPAATSTKKLLQLWD